MEPCRKCGREGVADPEAAGWGDSGTICPDCRAIRNAKARKAAVRITAMMTEELARDRGLTKLATIRSLPEMEFLRSIPYEGDGLTEQLPETWRELHQGLFLLTVGDGRVVRNVAVEVEDGNVVEQSDLTPEEAAELPTVLAALAAG